MTTLCEDNNMTDIMKDEMVVDQHSMPNLDHFNDRPASYGPDGIVEGQAVKELLQWRNHLSQVESKLIRFEKDIQDEESQLASTLNECEALLTIFDDADISSPKSLGMDDDDDDDTTFQLPSMAIADINNNIRELTLEDSDDNTGCNQNKKRQPRLVVSTKGVRYCCAEARSSMENNMFLNSGIGTSSSYLCEYCGHIQDASDFEFSEDE